MRLMLDECPECRGSGYVEHVDDVDERFPGGRGRFLSVDDVICSKCEGTGRRTNEEEEEG